jgi:hypothetical protein
MLSRLVAHPDNRSQTIDELREAIVRAYDTGQLPNLAVVVNHGVLVAIELGAWALAATLAAAVNDGPLAGLTTLVHPAEHIDRQGALDQVRAQLSADRYRAATTNAVTMTYQQVVQYTLAELDRLRAETDDNAGHAPNSTPERAHKIADVERPADAS